jgi:SAM-dependent methyltransferase
VQEPRFDVEETFDEDYLYFYEEILVPERTELGVDLIWRLLELEPGMEVLDLACGHGRIANRLAERGCRVTGLDVTPLFLDIARRDAAERGVDVDYVEGDMRSLPWSDRFDRVVSWFTSFGYFDDPGNRRVLAEAHRALKPGGRLLIESNNRDFVLSHFDPERFVERDGDFMLDRSEFDADSGRIKTERIAIRGGRVRRFHFFVRTFTFTELRDWLLQTGFGSVEAYGWEGEPFSLESRRMITVARR